MDIKGVVGRILPFSRLDSTKRTGNDLKTADRDANGQEAPSDHRERRHLTQEEIEAAVKSLADIPGVRENGLTVRLETKDGINVIYVEDHTGKVVRRIPESQFDLILSDKDKKSGHLLNKAL